MISRRGSRCQVKRGLALEVGIVLVKAALEFMESDKERTAGSVDLDRERFESACRSYESGRLGVFRK